MNRFAVGLLGILLVSGLGAVYAFGLINFGVIGSSCAMDEEIASPERAAANDAGMAFLNAVLSSRSETAYSMMTRKAQDTTSAEKLSVDLNGLAKQSFAKLRIAHTYFVETLGSGQDQRVVCGTISGTDWVAVEATPGARQAYVVISAETINNDWAFTFWLLSEGANWRVHSFHADFAAIVGRTPDDLLKLARQQSDAGHAFNAQMLYVALGGVVGRGPVFQLGIVQTIQGDLRNFKRPTELQGQPPFNWRLSGMEYKVRGVTILGIDGKLGLIFILPQAIWNGDDDADKRNHAFLDAFMATHPEYSEVFGFLVAQAQKPDDSGGFRTVYEANKGYH